MPEMPKDLNISPAEVKKVKDTGAAAIRAVEAFLAAVKPLNARTAALQDPTVGTERQSRVAESVYDDAYQTYLRIGRLLGAQFES